jgi:hypothetical protein
MRVAEKLDWKGLIGMGVVTYGINRPTGENDNTPPSGVEIKNAWS